MVTDRLSQNRGESGPRNDVPGKIGIPVTTPACAQTRWGCGSRLLHFFLLLKIEATVTVITCSDSGNGFLFLKYQRPQLTMSCSEIWNTGDIPSAPAAVRTWAAMSVGCSLCTECEVLQVLVVMLREG